MKNMERRALPATIVAGLVATARAHGLDCQPWFAGLPLDADTVDSADARLSYRDSITVIERALRAWPRPSLGLEVGTRGALTPMGMLGFAMMSSRTMQQAVDFGLEYHQAAGSLLDFHLEIDDRAAQGWLVLSLRRPEPLAAAFLFEEALSSIYLLIKGMVGDGWDALRVEWPYPEPADKTSYARIFGCDQYFGASQCRLLFDPELLARPLKNHSEVSLGLAQQACRQLIASLATQDDLVATIRRIIRSVIPQRIRIDEVAARLHMSERSLRRRLEQRELSYQGLRNAEWAACAEQALHGATVAQVAERLGFGDAREFRRAFKRWTGRAPREDAKVA